MTGKNPNCAYKNWDCMPCTNCDAYIPTMTNAGRIRATSNEELERLLTEISYGREEPWSLPFKKACCDTCPTVKGTVVETGQEMEFTECDFTDGKCPHGDAVKWWLNQPVGQTGTDEHEYKQTSGLLEED